MKSISLFLLLFGLMACGSETYEADSRLDKEEQRAFVQSVIRLAGKMPDKADLETRFSEKFDQHYAKQAAGHDLRFYYHDKNTDYQYFLLTRIAPSIKKKYVALGGKLKFNNGEITEYEEIFRTWKMEEEELMPKAEMLFAKMIKGRDLSMYYPENSGTEEYIEFPNKDVWYDTEDRIWKSKRENVLEPYYEQIREMGDR